MTEDVLDQAKVIGFRAIDMGFRTLNQSYTPSVPV